MVGLPGSTNRLPVIKTSLSEVVGGLAELDGLVVAGLRVVSSADGSGGSD